MKLEDRQKKYLLLEQNDVRASTKLAIKVAETSCAEKTRGVVTADGPAPRKLARDTFVGSMLPFLKDTTDGFNYFQASWNSIVVEAMMQDEAGVLAAEDEPEQNSFTDWEAGGRIIIHECFDQQIRKHMLG